MEQLPLTILIDATDEAVLFENDLIAGLIDFELDTSEPKCVKTTFVCTNCFPRRSGHRVSQHDKYPLRIHVGNDPQQVLLTYAGRPISHFRNLYLMLSATRKRIIRITACKPLPKGLNTALLDLGVEIIVQSADMPTAGDIDACL